MKKTLLIHIGHYKTGTTALQVFFGQNRDFLAGHGIDYPDIWYHNSKHSAFAFAILRAAGVEKLMHGYQGPTPPAEMWQQLYDHVMASPQPLTLISSEEFMRMGEFPRAQEILAQVLAARPEGLKIRAIAYLREPQAHIRSWYNQLVKMGFPLADLNSSLRGEIETIHYDYRRAFSPWVEGLGAENVLIRSYVKDPEKPDALHRDFLATIGVDLPEGMIEPGRDPNPRLDDRLIELVRLMQNMEFPRPVISAIRKRAARFLEQQDCLVPEGDAGGIETVRQKAREGLSWLAELPGTAVPIETYANRLPEVESEAVRDINLLAGFVLSEVTQLRLRMKRSDIDSIDGRLAVLEQHMAGKREE